MLYHSKIEPRFHENKTKSQGPILNLWKKILDELGDKMHPYRKNSSGYSPGPSSHMDL